MLRYVVLRPTRPARAIEAAAIAEIHVLSWQAAYAGQLPDDYLDNLSISERQHRWEQALSEPTQPDHMFIVAQEDVVAGFASIDPSRDDDTPAGTGELRTIYLHPRYWNRGLGRLRRYASTRSRSTRPNRSSISHPQQRNRTRVRTLAGGPDNRRHEKSRRRDRAGLDEIWLLIAWPARISSPSRQLFLRDRQDVREP